MEKVKVWIYRDANGRYWMSQDDIKKLSFLPKDTGKYIIINIFKEEKQK